MPDRVQRWNADKPHRCPNCHAVAIDVERPKRRWVYTCCRCGARFARWPRLAWLLPGVGVRCSECFRPDADARSATRPSDATHGPTPPRDPHTAP